MSAQTQGRIRADASLFTPGNFITDAIVHPSLGRPSGHRPSVRYRPRDNPAYTCAEGSQHSNVNQGEAHMVVALARCTALELENPEGLKILAAYNGHVGILTPW
jgi:hypothetical protein